MSTCDGCMGSRRCWVCLGTGELVTRNALPCPCHRCAATGRCTVCGDLEPTADVAEEERARARFERLIILASDP